jgi:hypothetical protein
MADLQGNTIAAGAITAGSVTTTGAAVSSGRTLTYGTTVATNAASGNYFTLTVTDGVAFTISPPTNATAGQILTYTIKNTSGGAVGTITWDTIFKKAAFTTPATANQRSITFVYDGTNWIELYKTAADVGN